MGNFFSKKDASRQNIVQNLAAAAFSAPFNKETYQIRLAASADTYFLVSEAANHVPATATSGSLLPAGRVDYIIVSPGQVISATAAISVTEMC